MTNNHDDLDLPIEDLEIDSTEAAITSVSDKASDHLEPYLSEVRIVDVEYTGEDVTKEGNSNYNCILVLVQEVQTNNFYIVRLTEPEVRAMGRSKMELNPKTMLAFANDLAKRTHPLQVMVDPNLQELPLDLIMTNTDNNQTRNEDVINKFKQMKGESND